VASAVISPTEPQGSVGQSSLGLRRYLWRLFVAQREIAPFIIALGLFVFFWVDSPAFLTTFSLFAPWVMYWMWTSGIPVGWAILIALGVAAGIGAINGLITVMFNVPSFVTTLATNFILVGMVLIYSNDTEATPVPGAVPPEITSAVQHVGFFSQMFGVWEWSEILWVLVIVLVVQFMLRRTRFGVRVISTGGNLMGAAEAGVPVRRVKVWCFVLCSFLAGMVGIVDSIKYGSLDPGNLGINYILYAVAACVIGGTSLIGGLLIGVLEAGLTIIGISSNDFYVYVGLVLIAAMALNVWLDRVATRTRMG